MAVIVLLRGHAIIRSSVMGCQVEVEQTHLKIYCNGGVSNAKGEESQGMSSTSKLLICAMFIRVEIATLKVL